MLLFWKVKCEDCGFLGLVPVSFKYIIGESFYVDWEKVEEIPPHWREIAKYIHAEDSPKVLGCYKRQFHQLKCFDMDVGDKIPEEAIKSITIQRRCNLFYRYHPGYTPREHKELQRDDLNRRSSLRSNIISAIIGATLATIVNIIWNLLN